MKHLCYVYIKEYKCLKDIDFILDSHYNYNFSNENNELTITKNEDFPSDFWGPNIYSVAAIIGNNGTGKSTAMSFLLDFLVEGSACQSVNGVIVYEQRGELYFYGNTTTVTFDGKRLKPTISSIGLKDSKWKIPCLYHSGHFSPYINNDPRNSHLSGSYFASDNVRLVEDLQDDSDEDVLPMHLPLLQYLNRHVAQNNYRICMMLANKELFELFNRNRFNIWPRYVVISINQSGKTAIENSIRNEKIKKVKLMEGELSSYEVTSYNTQVNEGVEDYKKQMEYDKRADIHTSSYRDAKMYYAQGDYEKALVCFGKALSEYKGDAFGSLAIYINMTGAYYAMKDYVKALDCCKKALTICYSGSSIYSSDMAITLCTVAKVYYAMEDYETALGYYTNALTYVSNDFDRATMYSNIARVYYRMDDVEKALKNYEKALNFKKRVLGEEHTDTIALSNNIARLYSAMGDYDNALKFQSKTRAESGYSTTDKNDNVITVPPFKPVFSNPSKDHFLSQLIYYNLLNIINDKWGWRNGFDIVNDWQDRINGTDPILEQFDGFINEIPNREKKKSLRSLYEMLVEIQSLTKFHNKGKRFLYIDCKTNNNNLMELGEKILSNKSYLTSKYFDFSYAHTLDSETILSSGEQELLNLFSRLYDAIVLRPNKYFNLQMPSLLMLDEAEIGFHPDWQRKYLKLVIDFIGALKSINTKMPEFQIIISTHSPILLSDIPLCCTNYLKQNEGQTVKVNSDEIGETFAENVFQLYRRSFFMNEGLVGEFARDKINKLKDRIEAEEKDSVLNEIKMIGDDAIREFLMEKYLQKHPKNESLNDKIIKYYKGRIKQLEEQKNNKNE